jgi:hypothetical protein
MSDDSTKLYPAWRQAERDLLASGFTYGSLVTQEWLDAAFGITEPKTIAEHQKRELVRLRQTQELRDSLLENHRIMLAPVRGVGFTAVPPDQQTSTAWRHRTREVKAALQKLAREISHVDLDRLSDAQRQENADAQAKLGSLRALMRKQLKGKDDV